MNKPISLIFCLLLVSACNDQSPPQFDVRSVDFKTQEGRWYNKKQVKAGKPLFKKTCAVCHGTNGEGAPDWKINYGPPALNGTGHTWHHHLTGLDNTIRNGTISIGGSMPPLESQLDSSERAAVLAYIQNWWSDDIYQAWISRTVK